MALVETDQSNNSVQVTLQIPKEIYRRVSQTADGEHCLVEDFLSQLVVKTLQVEENYKLWKSISDKYRSRLEHEGRLDQSPEKILNELRLTREKVTNELYPE